jgi:hypothetical protein
VSHLTQPIELNHDHPLSESHQSLLSDCPPFPARSGNLSASKFGGNASREQAANFADLFPCFSAFMARPPKSKLGDHR